AYIGSTRRRGDVSLGRVRPGVGPFLRTVEYLHSSLPRISQVAGAQELNALIEKGFVAWHGLCEQSIRLGDWRPIHLGQGVTDELGPDRRKLETGEGQDQGKLGKADRRRHRRHRRKA